MAILAITIPPFVKPIAVAAAAVIVAAVVATFLYRMVSRWRARRAERRLADTAVSWAARWVGYQVDDLAVDDTDLIVWLSAPGQWRWDRTGRRSWFDTPARRTRWWRAGDRTPLHSVTDGPERGRLVIAGAASVARDLQVVVDGAEIVSVRVEGTGGRPGAGAVRFCVLDAMGTTYRARWQRPRPGAAPARNPAATTAAVGTTDSVDGTQVTGDGGLPARSVFPVPTGPAAENTPAGVRESRPGLPTTTATATATATVAADAAHPDVADVADAAAAAGSVIPSSDAVFAPDDTQAVDPADVAAQRPAAPTATVSAGSFPVPVRN